MVRPGRRLLEFVVLVALAVAAACSDDPVDSGAGSGSSTSAPGSTETSTSEDPNATSSTITVPTTIASTSSTAPPGPGEAFVFRIEPLCPTDTFTTTTLRIIDVSADDVLNMRAGAGVSFDILAGFPNGTEVAVIDGISEPVGSGTWVLVGVPLLPGQAGSAAPFPNGCAWVNQRFLG